MDRYIQAAGSRSNIRMFNIISAVLILSSLSVPVAAMAYAIQWSPFK